MAQELGNFATNFNRHGQARQVARHAAKVDRRSGCNSLGRAAITLTRKAGILMNLKDYEYYRTDSGVLYHGDCLEIMPHLEPVDLVLTDPPYGMNFRSNHREVKHSYIVGDDLLPIDRINMAIKKALAAAYIFCRWDNIYDLPKPKSLLVWWKNNWSMGDLEHEHGRQWEAVCFYCNGKHKFKKRIPDVLKGIRTGNNYHPTEKPVGIMTQLIHANICESVLDPFIGSGTTAIACERLNRRWIGIEIEEKYCEIAKKRIEQERKQLKLF